MSALCTTQLFLPLQKVAHSPIKWTNNHQADCLLYMTLLPGLVICKKAGRVKDGMRMLMVVNVLRETKCH